MRVLITGVLTSRLNGSANSFMRLARALGGAHEVIPLIPDSEGVGRDVVSEFRQARIMKQTPLRRKLGALVRTPRDLFVFWRELGRIEPDLVYINDVPWCYFILACRARGIPAIIHSRYDEPSENVRKLLGVFLRQAARVVFVSDFNRNRWIQEVTAGRSVVIHNPGVTPGPTMPQRPVEAQYCLLLARVAPEKGIRQGIELFSQLVHTVPDLWLVIAGDAVYPNQERYREHCVALAKSLGVDDRVKWLGEVSSSGNLFLSCSAFIHLPEFEDPFPTTIMEALILNAPIITTRKGGIPEQVTGFDGVYYIEDWNVGQIAEKVFHGPSVDRANEYEKRFGWPGFVSAIQHVVMTEAKGR